jgi:hypothetical protein
MGKLTNGIYGPIRGKVGPVVGSSWKGEYYIKSRPRRRTKKRGAVEKINQGNFASVHYWLQPVIEFLRAGFKGYGPRVEGFNAAKSYALKHAFSGDAGNKLLDPALVQVSYGNLPLPSHISIAKSDDYTLQFTWDTSLSDGASAYDQAMLLAYDNKKKEQCMKLTGQFRSNGNDKLILPQTTGLNYHVYIAFTAHDRSRQSHSVYLGVINT